MAAKMAATNLILTYLCSAIIYEGKESVHAVIVLTVRRGDQLFEAQEQQLHIFQDGGQDGRREYEFNVPQLCFQIQRQMTCPVI